MEFLRFIIIKTQRKCPQALFTSMKDLVNVEKYVISKDKIFKDEESFNIIKILVLVN